MVGDEMYSKSWFCQVLLKLIQVKFRIHLFLKFIISFSLLHLNNYMMKLFSTIRQQGDDYFSTNPPKKQELDETI